MQKPQAFAEDRKAWSAFIRFIGREAEQRTKSLIIYFAVSYSV